MSPLNALVQANLSHVQYIAARMNARPAQFFRKTARNVRTARG